MILSSSHSALPGVSDPQSLAPHPNLAPSSDSSATASSDVSPSPVRVARPGSSSGRAIELAVRRRLDDDDVSVSTAGESARNTQREDLRAYLHRLFQPHRTDDNAAHIDRLVESRGRELHNRGYTVAELEQQFSFMRNVDIVSMLVIGAAGSSGFAMANILGLAAPLAATHPAAQGAMSGAITFMLSHIIGHINKTVMQPIPWLRLPADQSQGQVDAVIADALKARGKTFRYQLKEMGISYLAFPASFLVSAALATGIAQSAGTPAANVTKKVLDPIASLAAGSATAWLRRQYFDEADHYIGPALLLSRTDWLRTMQTLKDWNYEQALALAGKTVSNGLSDRAKKGLKNALKELALPAAWLKAAVPFSAGFAANKVVATAFRHIASDRNASDAQVFAAEHLAFATGLLLITELWILMSIAGKPLDDATLTLVGNATDSADHGGNSPPTGARATDDAGDSQV